jgi:hypothetical protein
MIRSTRSGKRSTWRSFVSLAKCSEQVTSGEEVVGEKVIKVWPGLNQSSLVLKPVGSNNGEKQHLMLGVDIVHYLM